MIESFEWTESLEQLNQAFRTEWGAKLQGEAEPILNFPPPQTTAAGMMTSLERHLELLAANAEIECLREQLRQAEARAERAEALLEKAKSFLLEDLVSIVDDRLRTGQWALIDHRWQQTKVVSYHNTPQVAFDAYRRQHGTNGSDGVRDDG